MKKKLGGKSRLSKSPVCPSQLVGVEKVRGVEQYSDIKRSEALRHATTGVNLKNIMTSERGQTQKTT